MNAQAGAGGDRSRMVLVTGGASGIGLEAVRVLQAEGWRVVAADRDGRALSGARDLLRESGDRVEFVTLDVTDETAVRRLVAEVGSRLGPLRGIVNSAGIAQDVPFFETTADQFRRIHEVNVVGAFVVSQAGAQVMRDAGGGAIVNVTSVSGMRGNTGRSVYGASKAALLNLTQVMAVELASCRIRVNAVAPGPIDTALTAAMHSPRRRQDWLDRVPQHRYGQPRDVASAIAFLLDETRASYVTGQTLAVDGGFLAAGLIE